MLLLAGLMGLMALGSVAIVSIGDAEDEPPPDESDEFDAVSAGADRIGDTDQNGAWAVRDDAALEDGRSLFDRMGLINMLEGAPPEAGNLAAQHEDVQVTAEVLKLHGYRIKTDYDASESDVCGEMGHLDYDADEDQLLIVFDDSAAGPDPELELRISEGDPSTTEVRVGDAVLARLPTVGAPPLSAIVLVGESDAAALGLAV